MSVELGDTAKDIVTGYEGVVTSHARYLTGCDQYSIQPEAKGGTWAEGRWFDVNRLEVVKKDAVRIEKSANPKENGGPSDNPAPIR